MALTTDFVTAVRRQGSIPSSLTSADVLAIGDEEIQARFVPLLESVRQNYLVREVTVSPDARGRVALPIRAVGAALRSVQWYTGNGWVSLPQRDLGDADYLSAGAIPSAFAVDGGSILLLPTGTTATLRLRYAARPGRMCLDTDATLTARITSVTAGTTSTALAVAAYTGSNTIDVVSSGPAHQQKAIATTYTAPNVPTADLLEQPIVGDYIVVSDRTPFVPLPEELFSALVHATAANILLSLGYLEEAGAQEARSESIAVKAKEMLLPRVEGNPRQVKGGLLRGLRGASWRGRRY